jgi:transcriptional regulator with XRE-family HTH domain
MAEDKTHMEVIAANLRRIRTSRGLRQEEVAEAARRTGLAWTDLTVTAVERRRRAVSLAEFWLLLYALDTTTDELLAGRDSQRVLVDGARLRLSDLRLLARGESRAARLESLRRDLAKGGVGIEPTDDEYRIAEKYGLDPEEGSRRAVVASLGSAEVKAARRLGVSPYEVGVVALALWGKGLTDKREDMLAGHARGDARALRGHITRSLMAEIAERISGGQGTEKRVRKRR